MALSPPSGDKPAITIIVTTTRHKDDLSCAQQALSAGKTSVSVDRVDVRELLLSTSPSYLNLITAVHLGIGGFGDGDNTHNIEWLPTLKHLQTLRGRDAHLGDAHAQIIGACIGLTHLVLEQNRFSVKGIRSLSTLTNLTYLDLSYNNIGFFEPKDSSADHMITRALISPQQDVADWSAEKLMALTRLTHLTALDLCRNDLTDESLTRPGTATLVDLSPWKNLRTLRLFRNSIGVKWVTALVHLPALEELDLRYNDLEDHAVKSPFIE